MAQNNHIGAHMQGPQNQHLHRNGPDNDGNQPSIEVQDLPRQFGLMGGDDYQLILPQYMADISKKVLIGACDGKLGVQPTEINRLQQRDDIAHRALLNAIHVPND